MIKLQNTLLLIIALLFSNVCIAQTTIKEYKANDHIYLVGDRVFSLYYITPDGVIVIDPINDAIAKKTMQLIKEKTNLPVKYVIYSHNHWDHNGGGQTYKDQGAEFIMHGEAFKNLAENKKIITPDSIWKGNQNSITLGNKQVELFYYGRNHGSGMTIFRFPEYNAVFTVDLVVPDRVLYTYLPDAKPKQWLEDLYEIEKLEFNDLYMAHVRPIGSRKDIELQIQYFEDLYRATEKALQDGIPFFEIPNKVKLPQYKHFLFYDEWLHMNVWRILMEKSIGQ
ncbi:MBL fold metallo-hydrolase [Psychroserpens sp. XS_ASV72]|uniref:MBL fold metallo-hydrolase n=1 Tax=Psychroserpens sp. XS_ASV72 TaxID=3241293 RepID=UPI003514E6E5